MATGTRVNATIVPNSRALRLRDRRLDKRGAGWVGSLENAVAVMGFLMGWHWLREEQWERPALPGRVVEPRRQLTTR